MEITKLLSSSEIGSSNNGNEADISGTFSSKLPSGEVVFSRPFGKKTSWKTSIGGSVDVAVLFDPSLPYSTSHQTASTCGELSSSLRRAIGNYLVPEKMINQIDDVEETIFSRLRDILSNDVFVSLCNGLPGTGGSASKGSIALAPEFLTRYIKFLEKGVVESFNEDAAILEAINNKKFLFTYYLAIDSYPSQSNNFGSVSASASSSISSSSTSTPSENMGPSATNINKRRGVLVIHFDADPERKCDMPELNIPLKENHTQSKKESASLEEVFKSINMDASAIGNHNSTKWVKEVRKMLMIFFFKLEVILLQLLTKNHNFQSKDQKNKERVCTNNINNIINIYC